MAALVYADAVIVWTEANNVVALFCRKVKCSHIGNRNTSQLVKSERKALSRLVTVLSLSVAVMLTALSFFTQMPTFPLSGSIP
jgi:hypothetical protein